MRTSLHDLSHVGILTSHVFQRAVHQNEYTPLLCRQSDVSGIKTAPPHICSSNPAGRDSWSCSVMLAFTPRVKPRPSPQRTAGSRVGGPFLQLLPCTSRPELSIINSSHSPGPLWPIFPPQVLPPPADYFLPLWNSRLWIFHVNEIIRYLGICNWLVSLNTTFSRFAPVVAGVSVSFAFMVK